MEIYGEPSDRVFTSEPFPICVIDLKEDEVPEGIRLASYESTPRGCFLEFYRIDDPRSISTELDLRMSLIESIKEKGLDQEDFIELEEEVEDEGDVVFWKPSTQIRLSIDRDVDSLTLEKYLTAIGIHPIQIEYSLKDFEKALSELVV